MKQKYTKSNVNKLIFVGIIILGIILLTSIQFIRSNFKHNPSFIGYDSYFNYRILKIAQTGDIPLQDNLSFGGRPFSYNLAWPHTLIFISNTFHLNLDKIFYILPIIFGILSLILFWLIIKKIFTKTNIANASSLILVLSPPYLFFFSTNTSFSLIFFISLLSIYLLTFKNKFLFVLSFLLASLISAYSIIASIFFGILLLVYIIMFNREKIKLYFIYLALNFLVIYFIINNIFSKYGSLEMLKFDFLNELFKFSYRSLLSDFGGKIGLSIFSIFLLFIGIYVLWQQNKYKYFLVYFGIFLIIILAMYFDFILFYVSIVIALIGSLGLTKLIERKWESDFIKTLSIFIVISGVVFSGLSFINELSSSEPTSIEIQALNFLKIKSSPGDTIFGYYNQGFLFNFIDRKNIMDANIIYSNNPVKRFNDFQEIMNSNNPDNVINLLNEYSIDYIWIDQDLVEKYYDNQQIKFLFQLKYDKRFEQILRLKSFENGKLTEIDIWRYKKT